jgi:predicted DsbA family dithiol-disulfide isomerase
VCTAVTELLTPGPCLMEIQLKTMQKEGIAITAQGLKKGLLKPVIKIDIVSDVVCPWCYIGKRRLEKAMDAAGDKFKFEVTYHPFELNPGTPSAGLNQREHLAEKFGGDDRYESITGHTSGVAAQEGLVMNFDQQAVIPNTRKAHAIIFAAQAEKKQLAVTEAFFKAYFTDGVDLSKDENLLDVATKAGLDRIVAETAIGSTAVLDSISEQEHQMQKLGIRGVPFYIFNNEYGVSGAQASEAFLKVFDELKVSTDSSGESCEVGGDC